jgi:PhoPQ-activated pathogenicity-related protein
MSKILRFIATLLLICLSRLATAEGLSSYLTTLAPAADVVVLDRALRGPTRVSFQSQVWRSIPWRHELLVTVPTKLIRTDFVVLSLTGGRGGASHHENAQRLADALGVRTVVLTQVPNQPLYDGKTEDELLSFSLSEYRRSGDPTWPLLFPMVSSVVRGIDVLQQLLGEQDLKVVLIGASKRGWTTYLTASVDRRVVGMVPAVFEMISMPKQIALARTRYGRDSEKIRPYTALGLTDALLEPRVAQLVDWLDPASYMGRLTIPKLVLLGANDPYWVVDSVRGYWSNLPEPKLLRILPNVGHGVLAESEAHDAVVAFVRILRDQGSLPSASWTFSAASNGQALISGESELPLVRCRLWRATSISADFRSARFVEAPCQVRSGGRGFTARVTTCSNRSTAAFAELVVKAVHGLSEVAYSTESHVWLASPESGGACDEPRG